MNKRMLSLVIGRVMLVEAVLMMLPLGVSLCYGERDFASFLIPIALLFSVGLFLIRITPRYTAIYARDGFTAVAVSWIVLSVFGALPFWISGAIPHYVDALFETVSGFTTTGATILPEVESMGYGLLFWRSLTHWIGGMGVLVFIMAVVPMTDGHGMHLLRAEVPGPTVGKLVSRMGKTAKILYAIYLILTVVLILLLLVGGMPLFDSCIHAFGSAGTGGFSNRNLSVGAYGNAYFDVVIGVFVLLFGVNFNLYYFLLLGRVREVLRSEELRAYLGIVAAATGIITLDVLRYYDGFFEALRHAFFQVSSIITTTGFTTVDFNLWPSLSKGILVLLMFVGACAGSTGGGLKVSRVVILAKSAVAEMRRMLHPNAVITVRFEGKPVSRRTTDGVSLYLAVYLFLFVLSTVIVTANGFDLITSFSAVVSCFNNIGPGLEVVGPLGNFGGFSVFSKLVLIFDMLAGRLEIYPLLLIFGPIRTHRARRSEPQLQEE